MCVLVVKNDKDGKPLCAKSRIVVLEKFEDLLYQKSHRYAPVLKYSSLRLLTAKASGEDVSFQKVVVGTYSAMSPFQTMRLR